MRGYLKWRVSMSQNNQYLIIAQSGRALASSAKNAGIETHVIDLFADDDTTESALSSHMLNSFSTQQDHQSLVRLVTDYVADNPKIRIIIGSGFEDKLDILRQLQRISPLLTNHAHIVKQVKNPITLMQKLHYLALPYPKYVNSADGISDDTLLMKTVGQYGGSHVRLYKQGMVMPQSSYLQYFVAGKHYSATFIANGTSFNLFGFNEIWTRGKDSDFTFSGAASNAELPTRLCRQVTEAISRLVVLLKLKGLCGLDFIVQNTGRYVILEINPRPTATFELYEQHDSLFKQHVDALSGQLAPRPRPRPRPSKPPLSKALAVLYASKNMRMPRLQWPQWMTDRPQYGRLIANGMPICTVHATGANIADAKRQLVARVKDQSKLLGLPLDSIYRACLN